MPKCAVNQRRYRTCLPKGREREAHLFDRALLPDSREWRLPTQRAPWVAEFSVGRRLSTTGEGGNWSRYAVVPAYHVWGVPDAIPDEHILMMRHAPAVPRGEWLRPSAADSARGHVIIRLAKYDDIRTSNRVRWREAARNSRLSGRRSNRVRRTADRRTGPNIVGRHGRGPLPGVAPAGLAANSSGRYPRTTHPSLWVVDRSKDQRGRRPLARRAGPAHPGCTGRLPDQPGSTVHSGKSWPGSGCLLAIPTR